MDFGYCGQSSQLINVTAQLLVSPGRSSTHRFPRRSADPFSFYAACFSDSLRAFRLATRFCGPPAASFAPAFVR